MNSLKPAKGSASAFHPGLSGSCACPSGRFSKESLVIPERLKPDFYLREDVVQVARDLVGKILWSRDKETGELCAGRIVETEAYRGPEDKACHAADGKRTERTSTLFLPGGVSYVYLCYGIHALLNVVTGPLDCPHAVLLRAVEPVVGLPLILQRRLADTKKGKGSGSSRQSGELKGECGEKKGKELPLKGNTWGGGESIVSLPCRQCAVQSVEMSSTKAEKIASGPGCLTQALGISLQENKIDLCTSNDLFITEDFLPSHTVSQIHLMDETRESRHAEEEERGSRRERKRGREEDRQPTSSLHPLETAGDLLSRFAFQIEPPQTPEVSCEGQKKRPRRTSVLSSKTASTAASEASRDTRTSPSLNTPPTPPIDTSSSSSTQTKTEHSSGSKDLAKDAAEKTEGPEARPPPPSSWQLESLYRVGVDYAGSWALKKWRFAVEGHPAVSARSYVPKSLRTGGW